MLELGTVQAGMATGAAGHGTFFIQGTSEDELGIVIPGLGEIEDIERKMPGAISVPLKDTCGPVEKHSNTC